MPILLKRQTKEYLLGLWELTENLQTLEDAISANPRMYLFAREIKSEARRAEAIAVRLLLKGILGFWPVIEYSQDGKPKLANSNFNLSISHTKGLVAVLLSDKVPGIDVEYENRSVQKVASRFLSESELVACKHQEKENLAMLLHWCSKEAVFKIVDEKDINFAKQIRVLMFDFAIPQGCVLINYTSHDGDEHQYHLNTLHLNNYLIVYCIQ
ncbi:MAG: 4'-phosphopantetheinyl transferase superfamily protein [Bacteroidota bacterium]|nr:4'-phosphopantetheinyl transferase superfamily protein [Bacteroidota bacterium]